MFEAIKHNTKVNPFNEVVLYPARVMVKTTSGYKELDLYVRESTGHVYAKNGQYFISLMRGGLTTNSKITWVELDGLDEQYEKCYLTYYADMTKKSEEV
jgi:hypothetical protein